VTATHSDIQRYKTNYLKEQEGIALYRSLAKAEKNSQRGEIFQKLAQAEEQHAARWAKLLEENGVQPPVYAPNLKVRLLGWIASTIGTQHVLPVVSGFESRDQGDYRIARGYMEESLEIALALDDQDFISNAFATLGTLHHLLGGGLVLPEIGGGGALLDLGEFLCRVSGVKDSSADRRPGASGPGICEAVHRVVVMP